MAGASFEKAQGEFARGVASNPHVQSAASEAAATGVRNAMSGDNRKWETRQGIKKKLGNNNQINVTDGLHTGVLAVPGVW